ncbi:sushi domain-containing protein 5 [Cyprinodon tularosa]|uniref:sushi domain-containing protein 5 n=1 Tax=Cyprinodon tularosa TaxID=77115 RepID=UPI0018E1FB64|nr:sushi domain-containing protein 5 [Cyprinodon tularosa]
MISCSNQRLQSLLCGCLTFLVVTSVVKAEGRVFILSLRNLQGFREAEQACASQHARLASAEELRQAVVGCFFSHCTRGWLYGATVGTTVCNTDGSSLKAVDVKTENATEKTAHLSAFCIKDKVAACGDPPSFPYARLQDHSGSEMGDELLYMCAPGYMMPSGHTSFSLLCDSCGEWYGTVQICVKDAAETHLDYEDNFEDSFEKTDHNHDSHEEVFGDTFENGKRILQQQETRFWVNIGDDHKDQLEVHNSGPKVINNSRTFEGIVEDIAKREDDFTIHPRFAQDRDKLVQVGAAEATKEPVSLLSQKHMFWFPSEAFQEEVPPFTGDSVTQATQRASGGQSEESKENESRERVESDHHDDQDDPDDHHDDPDDHHDDQDDPDDHHDDHDDPDDHHDDHDDRDDHHDDRHDHHDDHDDHHDDQDDPDDHHDDHDDHDDHHDKDDHDDSHHDELDIHEDDNTDNPDDQDSRQEEDFDDHIPDRHKDDDDHDDHYDMDEDDDHNPPHHGTKKNDDRDDLYDDHHSKEDHDDERRDDDREHPDNSEEHPTSDDHDDGEEHYDLDEDDLHNLEDRNKESYDDHDSREDDTDHPHVIITVGAERRLNITQKEEGQKTKGNTWLDGYPVDLLDSTKRQMRPSVVKTTNTPNKGDTHKQVHPISLSDEDKSLTTAPKSDQGKVKKGVSATSPDRVEHSNPPSYSDYLDYGTQQAAPTHSWLNDLTGHPFLDHGPAPPMHNLDPFPGAIEEHIVENLPGEMGEMEGEKRQTICVGEDCPPNPPSSTSQGAKVAAIIVAVCAVATAVIVGLWCFRRRQQKSSIYEMNGKQNQQIEMEQKV